MDEPAAIPPPAARSIGERLRAARERSGLSVAAAAEKLHLDAKVIESLEADRFGELGASVYVRGHLRRYADFVGEAGLEMVNSYSAREARPAPPDLTRVPHAERRADPRRLITPLVGVGCAAILLIAIWWVLAGSKGMGQSNSTLVLPDVPAPATAVTTPTPATAEAAGTATSAITAPSANTSGATSAATEAANAQQRREEAVPVRAMRLRLVLNNDSWVEVYDARRERLFYDVASAGSVQSVEGRPPFRVVLGNSAGVTVEVDGQVREIPATAADGEGARFVVNRSGSLAPAR